ncbi:MAG: TonB-dependent receptor, partial [Pseudomonadota bacterium]
GASVESVRSGGPDLEPEENDNITLGLVYQPSFINGLTLTLDWWKIEQVDVVGIFGDQNQISLDYLLRLQGSSNPNVVRADPTADDIALFTAAGLTPVGEIVEVRDSYTNLTPREFEGIDVGVAYSFDTRLGSFDMSLNAAFLDTAFQEPSPQAGQLIAAIADGTINDAVDVPGSQSLIEQNGRPEWRSTASVRWSKNAWGAGAFYNYVGEVVDTSVTGPNGEIFTVPSFDTLAVYGEYTFGDFLGGPTRLRVGARNVFDEDPPFADEFASGYFDFLHTNRGRFVYLDLRKDF